MAISNATKSRSFAFRRAGCTFSAFVRSPWTAIASRRFSQWPARLLSFLFGRWAVVVNNKIGPFAGKEQRLISPPRFLAPRQQATTFLNSSYRWAWLDSWKIEDRPQLGGGGGIGLVLGGFCDRPCGIGGEVCRLQNPTELTKLWVVVKLQL